MKPERQTPQPALDHRDPTALVRVDHDSENRPKRETVWVFFSGVAERVLNLKSHSSANSSSLRALLKT